MAIELKKRYAFIDLKIAYLYYGVNMLHFGCTVKAFLTCCLRQVITLLLASSHKIQSGFFVTITDMRHLFFPGLFASIFVKQVSYEIQFRILRGTDIFFSDLIHRYPCLLKIK